MVPVNEILAIGPWNIGENFMLNLLKYLQHNFSGKMKKKYCKIL